MTDPNNGGDPAMWTDAQRAIFDRHDAMMRDHIAQQKEAELPDGEALMAAEMKFDPTIVNGRRIGLEQPELNGDLLVFRGLVQRLAMNRRFTVDYGTGDDGEPYMNVTPVKRPGIQPGTGKRHGRKHR